MAVTLEDQVRKLHEDGLHSNVRALVVLMLSLPEYAAPLNECQSVAKKYQLLVYYGRALYQDELYKQAEVHLTEAIKLRKMLTKLKSKSTQASKQSALIPESEVQYNIYQCYMKLKDYTSAMSVLESFSPKQRTLKINMELAKLYEREGMERPAIMCYKEVLRSSPVAIEAAEHLLNLGVSFQEINALINFGGSSTSSTVPEWTAQYLKGHSFAAGNKHSKAVAQYRSLESQNLKNNIRLFCSMGKSYYRSGNKRRAINCYGKVRMLDNHWLEGMDIYSMILAEENQKEKLKKLTENLSEINKNEPELWVALSYYMSSINNHTKAEFFARKACMLDKTNVPAILARATQLQLLGNQVGAVTWYKEAIRLAPNQIEAYKGLVDCHISSEKYKEAMFVARNAHKTVGSFLNAATFTLCAKVCACEPQTQAKAKAMLNKALETDPSYLPAVCILSKILMKEEDYEAASTLLKKQVEVQYSDSTDYSNESLAELHCLIGECLKELGDTQQSIVHYGNALRFDPENKKAIQGIQSIERDVSDLDMTGIGVQESHDRSSIEELETAGSDIVPHALIF